MRTRKLTRTALPAFRIADVETKRCPLIATASAPASQSAFTTSCRSTSWIRLSCWLTDWSVDAASASRTTIPGPLTAVEPEAASIPAIVPWRFRRVALPAEAANVALATVVVAARLLNSFPSGLVSFVSAFRTFGLICFVELIR